MSVKRFKFVSPGIFVNEIDNSHLPSIPDKVGPVVVGRAERGPAMRPVTIQSQAEFVEMFGSPVPGGFTSDVWRNGNYQSPMYGTYAAMAYLRNNGPVTYVRLLGHEHEDKTTNSGEAGWKVDKEAYGLWLWDSAAVATPVTGTLAAVFYSDVGGPSLQGARRGLESETISASCAAILNTAPNREFKMYMHSDNTAQTEEVVTSFNFDKNSSKFIRKVFNTNPALTNDDSVVSSTNESSFWLGQTFENTLDEYLTLSDTKKVCGMIAPLRAGGAGTLSGADFRMPAAAGNTGWVFSQQLSEDTASFAPSITSGGDVSGGVHKLFKFHALNSGEWECANLKVSIQDIKYSRNPNENPYGSFTVIIRRASDNDASPQIVESFTGCTLNPTSPNYIKRKIGDQTLAWSEAERRWTEQGDFANQSRYVRVETDQDLDGNALDATCLPFGFFGPPRLKGFGVEQPTGNEVTTSTLMFIDGGSSEVNSYTAVTGISADNKLRLGHGSTGANLKLEFPKVPLRTTSDHGALSSRKQAYWGVDTLESGSNKVKNACWADLMYPLPDSMSVSTTDLVETSQWTFTLDDVKLEGANEAIATWASGNRAAGTSKSVGASWSGSLDAGLDRFTMPLWGGFDGLDVKQLDPFSSDIAIGSAATDRSNYAYYSIRKAVDTVSDAEVVEMNVLAAPGITVDTLNNHIVNVCEQRADALAIVDIGGGYKPRANRTASATFATYGGSATATLQRLDDMGLNSSYACCYYPWVQIKDTTSGAALWAPPSVVALGTMGSAETKSDVWFAPAGFTRGGLSEGSAGMPVSAVRDRLTSKQRDDLYAANVNPIATFPAEGIVIFGQKTLQTQASALDRINVRRLMIFVKKEISRMAATTLFEPNVQRTWNNFLGRINPFLRSVQSGLGLSDFKVVLDESTTTEELIDRNIMYAKILLKPTRAIEYIAIDFVITNSGASFED